MSRSVKVDLTSFQHESGHDPVIKKSARNMHRGECWMCTKGTKIKRAIHKATRRKEKILLREEMSEALED